MSNKIILKIEGRSLSAKQHEWITRYFKESSAKPITARELLTELGMWECDIIGHEMQALAAGESFKRDLEITFSLY